MNSFVLDYIFCCVGLFEWLHLSKSSVGFFRLASVKASDVTNSFLALTQAN